MTSAIGWLTQKTGKPVRYLVVGGWNTVFGYLCFTALYYLTRPIGVHYAWVMIVSSAVAVTQSYLTQRYLVFQPKAKVTGREFVRFSLVYLFMLGFSIVAFPLLVESLGLHVLLAQAVLTAFSVVLSYVAHSRFSFRYPR
jgi:putative flippase GtrA